MFKLFQTNLHSNIRRFRPTLAQFRSLFIQTQDTPNENALKFVPNGSSLLPSPKTPTVEINTIKDALEKSELAFKILSLNNRCVSSILLGYNFLTVVRKTDSEMTNGHKVPDWAVLKPQIFAILTEQLTMGRPVLTQKYYDYLANKIVEEKRKEQEAQEEDEEAEDDEEYEDESDEVEDLIKELLTTRIQPAIQEDGGDIKFLRWDGDTGTVYLKLIGACKSCSSSEITLKNGIEEMLKYYIDEVKKVEQVVEEVKQDDVKVDNQVESNRHIDTQQKDNYGDVPPAL